MHLPNGEIPSHRQKEQSSPILSQAAPSCLPVCIIHPFRWIRRQAILGWPKDPARAEDEQDATNSHQLPGRWAGGWVVSIWDSLGVLGSKTKRTERFLHEEHSWSFLSFEAGCHLQQGPTCVRTFSQSEGV